MSIKIKKTGKTCVAINRRTGKLFSFTTLHFECLKNIGGHFAVSHALNISILLYISTSYTRSGRKNAKKVFKLVSSLWV
jgi:hypothetical protein